MKLYLTLGFSVALIGCSLSIPKVDYYAAPNGTVHSLYPSQFVGRPLTPNQRIQVNGRGEYTAPSYTCLLGSMSVSFVGNMVLFNSINDKKKWPEYGYVSNRSESKAADGTNNINIFFTIENVEGGNRNAENGDFFNLMYELDFNDEILEDTWMHGKGRLLSVFTYYDHKAYEGSKSAEFVDIKCTTLDVENSVNVTKVIALKTMTLEQVEQLTNQN